jgi:hypothetical protein
MKPILFGGSDFEPTAFHDAHAVLISAERGAIATDQTGEAIGTGLKRPFFAVLRHDDNCFSHDLLGAQPSLPWQRMSPQSTANVEEGTIRVAISLYGVSLTVTRRFN